MAKNIAAKIIPAITPYAKLSVNTTIITVTIITIVSVIGVLFSLAIDLKLNVSKETINITEANATTGICST